MAISNENSPITVMVHLGSLTTDGTLIPAMYLPKKSRLVSAHVMNGATVAADNSNYFQLSLKSGSTAVATYDSRAANQGGVTANVAKAMLLVSGQEDRAAADSLSLLYNEAGTMALTDAKLALTYYPV